ncbi:MAG: thiol reductase thioredoxin [Flavobacteriia bacterium]|nr:thiol reductase thioredoxin [Flavobacteriia bacterium]
MQPKTLNTENFISSIHDYVHHREWIYKGEKPAIIHFWTDWCSPSQRVKKVLRELSVEYGDLIDFYRVNVDEEQELALEFGLMHIPSVLFIPSQGEPMMQPGEIREDVARELISRILLCNLKSAI